MSIQAEVNRSRSPTATSIDLRRLLDRLQHTLLSPSADRYLRKSSYQRTKVGANLDHARTLLLRLERDTPQTSSTPITTLSKAQLDESRALLKQLQDRLAQLNEPPSADATPSDDDSADENAEDLLARYAPALPNSPGIDTQDPTLEATANSRTTAAAANISSTLRSRQPNSASAARGENTATTTSTSLPQRQPLAQSTSPFAPPKPQGRDTAGGTDTLLNHHSTEQNALTDSLLTLATALKTATLNFSRSVDGSRDLLERTAQALEKNVGGMEAAGGRMGMLRKMTEGRGWWGRLSLYAWVGVGWVVALVVVFVLPKLRF